MGGVASPITSRPTRGAHISGDVARGAVYLGDQFKGDFSVLCGRVSLGNGGTLFIVSSNVYGGVRIV